MKRYSVDREEVFAQQSIDKGQKYRAKSQKYKTINIKL